MKCPICESVDVKKNGFNYLQNHSMQKYKCLACNKIFSYGDRLPNNHLSSEIVSKCFDLYFQGLSYRLIKRHLFENYNLKVTHVAIYGWIQSYTALMKKYVDSLSPNLSAVWQMDETFITFKGKRPELKLARSDGYYCWVCIDTGTRFVLDMHLGLDKSLDEGIAFFERIRQAIKDEPDVVATDGNITYQTCLKRYYPSAVHVRLRQISLEPNTSFIERYNGTIKNRTKTMRCFDAFYPCQTTLTAFQIYYNFLRPHMALGDKTPAQEAGINVEFPERWASLIRNALFFSG